MSDDGARLLLALSVGTAILVYAVVIRRAIANRLYQERRSGAATMRARAAGIIRWHALMCAEEDYKTFRSLADRVEEIPLE